MAQPLVNRSRARGSLIALGLCVGLLALADTALADPVVEPPVAAVGKAQQFTLVVPRETKAAYITMVEFYPPPNFELKTFAEADGWLRDFAIVSREVTVQKVVWTRAELPPPDDFYAQEDQPTPAEVKAERAKDARFSFTAVPTSSGPYPMEARETYSDGTVIHWTGSPSYAFPHSPDGTSVRAPIMLEYPSEGNGWVVWVIGIAAAAVLVGPTAAIVIRRRAKPKVS